MSDPQQSFYSTARSGDRWPCRSLWLSENKKQLDEAHREELAALVELSDDRSLDKLQASAVLKQLTWSDDQRFGVALADMPVSKTRRRSS